jgi:hypothetical protein
LETSLDCLHSLDLLDGLLREIQFSFLLLLL